MTSAIDRHFDYRLQVMNLRAARQQVLATNIANADTPGYQARDVDFATRLKQLQAGEASGALTTTHARHLAAGGSRGPAGLELRYRAAEQPSVDGNTVDLNREMARFSENAIRYQADLAFLQSRVSGLRQAISGQ